MVVPMNRRKWISRPEVQVFSFERSAGTRGVSKRIPESDSSRAEARSELRNIGPFSARLKPCPVTKRRRQRPSSSCKARIHRDGRAPRFFLFAVLSVFATTLVAGCSTYLAVGCHSYHVDTTIENRSGEPIRLLEVDYPSASYGADSLAAGADFHYRIQLQGKGQLKVLYTTNEGKPVQITGPTLAERQEGRLEVVLLPDGKAEFHAELTPAR